MQTRRLAATIAGATTAAALGLAPWGPGAASAQGASGGTGGDHAVFVQTDDAAGNQVVAYDRADDGSLRWAATYATGGLGGQLDGSMVDHLASQGSLAYDPAGAALFAVNAGSDTVSVFAVDGDRLALRQVVSSGGTFPVSVTASGSLVYVLDAGNGGSIAGFRLAGGTLHPVPGSSRALGLVIPGDSSQFTHTPGQVAFTPDGTQLLVTTKAASNAVDVFAVGQDGRPSAAPVVNSEPGTVPFAVGFGGAGEVLLVEAGSDALASFSLAPDGVLAPLDTVGTGQAATCWIAQAQGYAFTSNAGSPSLTAFGVGDGGLLTDLGNTTTDGGTVDAASSAGGRYLYVQTGAAGIVDEFAVSPAGGLTEVGSVTVPDAAGGEGIVAF